MVWLPLAVVCAAGLCVGSFVGVLVRRLPDGRPVALARSACESCGTPLGPRELVPLLSFVWQRGRCRHCGAAIPRFHPAIELAGLAVAASAWAALPEDPAGLWTTCALGWTLLALAWIDARHYWLPDALTLPLLLAGLAATTWSNPADAPEHALAAALGFVAFRAIALAYRRLRGFEGLGAGDAKLLAALGAWGGPALLLPTVLGAALLGLAGAGVLAAVRGRVGATTRLPFGTLLAAAFWVLWLWAGPG